MKFSIKLHIILISGWSIVYIEGSKDVISKKILYFFPDLKVGFVLANHVDPDEMPHKAEFHLGPHCFGEKQPIVNLHFPMTCILGNLLNFISEIKSIFPK